LQPIYREEHSLACPDERRTEVMRDIRRLTPVGVGIVWKTRTDGSDLEFSSGSEEPSELVEFSKRLEQYRNRLVPKLVPPDLDF